MEGRKNVDLQSDQVCHINKEQIITKQATAVQQRTAKLPEQA